MKSKASCLLKKIPIILVILIIFISVIFYGGKYFAFRSWDFDSREEKHAYITQNTVPRATLALVSINFLHNLYKHGRNSKKLRRVEKGLINLREYLQKIEEGLGKTEIKLAGVEEVLVEVGDTLVEVEDNLIESDRVTQEYVLEMFREETSKDDKKLFISENIKMDKKK